MITCDTKDLLSDIDKFILESERKLKGMVRNFAEVVTLTAIETTPLGNSAINSAWYEKRVSDPAFESYGLKPMEGFARGSWQVSMNAALGIQELYSASSGSMAMNIAENSLMDYKLGDDVIISNQGPYIKALESNYSRQTQGQGIMQPTLDSITRTYQLHLDDYYNKS